MIGVLEALWGRPLEILASLVLVLSAFATVIGWVVWTHGRVDRAVRAAKRVEDLEERLEASEKLAEVLAQRELGGGLSDPQLEVLLIEQRDARFDLEDEEPED